MARTLDELHTAGWDTNAAVPQNCTLCSAPTLDMTHGLGENFLTAAFDQTEDGRYDEHYCKNHLMKRVSGVLSYILAFAAPVGHPSTPWLDPETKTCRHCGCTAVDDAGNPLPHRRYKNEKWGEIPTCSVENAQWHAGFPIAPLQGLVAIP